MSKRKKYYDSYINAKALKRIKAKSKTKKLILEVHEMNIKIAKRRKLRGEESFFELEP